MEPSEKVLSEYNRLIREIDDPAVSDQGPVPDGPGKRIRLFRIAFRLTLLLILPFVVLIRGAVLASQILSTGAWLSLFLSGGFTALLVTVYLMRAGRRIASASAVRNAGWKIALVLVGSYLGYVTASVSRANLKSDELKSYYHQLNPILRVGLGTIILLDSDMIVTDLQRDSSDYAKMGLPTRARSLHYVQRVTGYVHAVDLRTIGQPQWKNWAVAAYFRVMGFKTVRHVGTADHLHVSLDPPTGKTYLPRF